MPSSVLTERLLNLFSKPLPVKAWIIDPQKQKVIERPVEPREKWESLIDEVVGDFAECYKLDNFGNALWCTDEDTNERYAWYFEGMLGLKQRRYSKGLVVSLGPVYWDQATIEDWLCWHDEQNFWGDV